MSVVKTGLGAATIAFGTMVWSTAVDAQSWRTVSSARDRRGEETLSAEVEFSFGTVRLSAIETGQLYRADARYDEDRFETQTSYDPGRGRLFVRLGGRDHEHPDWDHRETSQYLDLRLSGAVPTTLDITVGAAHSEIDLGGLTLVRANLKTGASDGFVRFSRPNRATCEALEIAMGAAELSVERLGDSRCRRIAIKGGAGGLTVDLGGAWDGVAEPTVSIDVGVGSVTVEVPRDLGIEIELTRFLASFEPEGFTRSGSRWVSSNFASAPRRVRLDVKAVLGEFDVRWVND
jgi:hypothetical protein